MVGPDKPAIPVQRCFELVSSHQQGICITCLGTHVHVSIGMLHWYPVTSCTSEGAVRERSPGSGLPMVERGMSGGVGVGEAPAGGLGALSMGNWAHIRAARNTNSSCTTM